MPSETLEAELHWLAHKAPHPMSIHNILTILIQDRKIKPTAVHYEALILGNCYPEYGSVENVKTILRDLEREDVPLDPLQYFAVLKVSDLSFLQCYFDTNPTQGPGRPS